MSILDDTVIFAAIIQQGGFSHAAKYLGLSNGLISRRIAKLESDLGVTLLKRTTRQIQLTPEGELFWQHAQRIQQEMDAAVCLVRSLAQKPKGEIRISAPQYFGRYYLMPIISKFMQNFDHIHIDVLLTDLLLDPVKENIDLLIRGTGYFEKAFRESSMRNKLLLKQKIRLYASLDYLGKYGEPRTAQELKDHAILGHLHETRQHEDEVWSYHDKGKPMSIRLNAKFHSNDVESRLIACQAGHGIGKFTDLVYLRLEDQSQANLKEILQQYDWGSLQIYAIYSQQHALPKRTRLLLDFISAHTQNLQDKIS